jgi:hypothetical protein
MDEFHELVAPYDVLEDDLLHEFNVDELHELPDDCVEQSFH